MMRGRSDGAKNKRLLTSVCVGAVFVVFLYVYFGSKNAGESALEYGSRSLRKLGSSYLSGDEDSDLGGKQDESLFKFGLDDGEDSIVTKSFPVSLSVANHVVHKSTSPQPHMHSCTLLKKEKRKPYLPIACFFPFFI